MPYGVPLWHLVFTLDGGSILPVFSAEDEAEMYLWFKRTCDVGWEVRRSSSEELISVLYGPCSDTGAVVLDPSPEIIEGRPPGSFAWTRDDSWDGWSQEGSTGHEG